RLLAGMLWRRTAGFIAANRAILEAARPLLEPGETPSAVIFPGIEDPGPPAPFPAGGPVIGILGRLDPVKGHEVFLQAAALILRRAPEASFLAAGREENTKTANLQSLARELGSGGRVRFLGHVADAAAFMRGCHLGVVASLGSEAVSRAAVEWLACARPLVASSVGCLPEYLEGCEGCELVPPGDPEALARAALSMLEPGRRDSASAAARDRYVDRFSMDRFGRDTERFFEGLT
ncbi:MAG: glycosyltransferase, partial [Elusimicrobiota bacterium]